MKLTVEKLEEIPAGIRNFVRPVKGGFEIDQGRVLGALTGTTMPYGSDNADEEGVVKLRLPSVGLEKRCLRVAREDAKTDASARVVELNADAAEAAARLIMRYREIIRKAQTKSSREDYLLPFCRSRVHHGNEKGALGYDPSRPQRYWELRGQT